MMLPYWGSHVSKFYRRAAGCLILRHPFHFLAEYFADQSITLFSALFSGSFHFQALYNVLGRDAGML